MLVGKEFCEGRSERWFLGCEGEKELRDSVTVLMFIKGSWREL